MDTFASEPLPEDHPFLTVPNILLSPHQASRDRGTGEQVSIAAAKAITDLMEGKKPEYVIDDAVYSSSRFKRRL